MAIHPADTEAALPATTLPTYRPQQAAKAPPCQVACVVSGDVRGWIGTIAQRKQLGIDDRTAFTRAWEKLTDINPFPAVLGRICPHPCEAGCNRNEKDAPVSINALERFLGDWAIDQGLRFEMLADEPQSVSVGVIGAGPSGLSFAYQMARRGYKVTVYEQRPQAGGMLRYGVPDYRLPPSILDAEIGRIIDLGVDLRLETAVGRDVTVEQLRDLHEVLYVGIGAQSGRRLGIPGEEGTGVLNGIEYLDVINRGDPVETGRKVTVIGGGNTAVDAARTARRFGAEVTILYRRGREEMPAVGDEVEEAIAEGVEIQFLKAPVRVERADGSIRALVVQDMELGDPDASGRRRPEPIEGSEHEIATDMVIAAVSQQPDWSRLEEVRPTDGKPSMTEVGEGLWVGGDAASPDIAGTAIAHGRSAAESAHAGVWGLPIPPAEDPFPIGAGSIKFEQRPATGRATPGRVAVEDALADPTLEVNRRIDEQEFLAEVDRCFSCGLCFGCSQCFMYCTVSSFTAIEDPQPGAYFTMNLDRCYECGKCIEVCPCGYLEVVPR